MEMIGDSILSNRVSIFKGTVSREVYVTDLSPFLKLLTLGMGRGRLPGRVHLGGVPLVR
ncbi:hypothetical protein BgiMline_018634, partial [Biomphalaria glabrata]